MQFFLCDVVARIVAIYLCVDCCRTVRHGLVERKIEPCPDPLDFFDQVFRRDNAPVQYWIMIGRPQVIALVACLVVAIFGWLPTNT